jgi:hypothetical protein
MKTSVKSFVFCALLGTAISANAVTYEVNPSASWIGFMNVFDIPQNGGFGPYPPNLGPYQFGSSWGTADLCAVFSSSTLSLSPNSIGDPNPYWYIPAGGPGAIGNKIMDANMYVEAGSLPGQAVTFTGTVLANTLSGKTDPLGNGWTSVAFIKDFAPDYSSFVSITAPLVSGVFNISLNTINDPARHVQYGFETLGPDVWITDVAQYGNIQIEAVPEPSSLALLGLGVLGVFGLRRRQ